MVEVRSLWVILGQGQTLHRWIRNGLPDHRLVAQLVSELARAIDMGIGVWDLDKIARSKFGSVDDQATTIGAMAMNHFRDSFAGYRQ